MILSRLTTAITLGLILSSCTASECPMPENWVMAAALSPSPVPYTPKPVFYAHETKPGAWMWQKATVTYEQLLKNAASSSRLNPQPLVLFDFAEDQGCHRLNATRAAIAKATGCSKDGVPCMQGKPGQLQ